MLLCLTQINNRTTSRYVLGNDRITIVLVLDRVSFCTAVAKYCTGLQFYILRKLIENELGNQHVGEDDCYICSLSSRVLVYKGQLTPGQVPAPSTPVCMCASCWPSPHLICAAPVLNLAESGQQTVLLQHIGRH